MNNHNKRQSVLSKRILKVCSVLFNSWCSYNKWWTLQTDKFH